MGLNRGCENAPAGVRRETACRTAELCASSQSGTYVSGILKNFAVEFEPRPHSSRPTLRDGH